MRKTSLLAGAALLLGAYTATAAEDYTCATPPTCAELGYTDAASACPNNAVKCPFDKTKVKCIVPIGVLGDCYFSDGSFGDCSLKADKVGKIVQGIYLTRLGYYVTDAPVNAVLLRGKVTGNWYSVMGQCRSKGGVIATVSDLYFNKDKLNAALSKLGDDALETTNLWGPGESSATTAQKCTDNGCSSADKTTSLSAYCVRYLN